MIVAFVWFVYRSWVCKYALVDLKVLKDRNFLLGNVGDVNPDQLVADR